MKKTFEGIVTAEFIDGQILSVLNKLQLQAEVFETKMMESEKPTSYEIKKLKQEIQDTIDELDCCVEARCKKDNVATKIKDNFKGIVKSIKE